MIKRFLGLIVLGTIIFCAIYVITIFPAAAIASNVTLPPVGSSTLVSTTVSALNHFIQPETDILLTTETPTQVGKNGETVTYTVRLKNIGVVTDSYKIQIYWKNFGFWPGFDEDFKTHTKQYNNVQPQEEIAFVVNDIIIQEAAVGNFNQIIVEATGIQENQARLQLTTVVTAPTTFELVKQYGLTPHDIFVQEHYGYVYDSTRMSIVDVSNPATLAEIGSYFLPPNTLGEIKHIVVQDDYAYVAAGLAGLHILDISNPKNPQEVSVYKLPTEIPGQIERLAISGNYIYTIWNTCYHSDPAAPSYAACQNSELRIIDISNPANPVRVGLLNQNEYVSDLTVQGDYVFLISEIGGLRTIDVSNPTSPIEISVYETIGSRIDIEGDYAYIASGRWGLRIMDISNPKNPHEVGMYNSSYVNEVTVENEYAYASADANSVRVIDISNPTSPVEIGLYKAAKGRSIFNITVQDNYVYLPDFAKGLQIVNFSFPITPTEVSIYGLPSAIQDMVVQANFAYLADKYYGLQIMDVSNPVIPVNIGSYSQRSGIRSLAISGNYVYAYAVTEEKAVLSVIDVSNLSEPVEAMVYELPFTNAIYAGQSRIIIVDHYVYLLDLGGHLHTLDISDPTKPTIVQLYDDYTSKVIDLDLSDDHLYVLQSFHNYAEYTDNTTLDIIDTSNPSGPRKVGSYSMPYFSYNIILVDDYAYLPIVTFWNDTHGTHYPYSYALQRVGISDHSNPIDLGDIRSSGISEYFRDMTVSGTYGYIAAGKSGLRLVDISNPDKPEEIGSYALPGETVKTTILGDYIYAVSDSGGIFVLQYQ